MASAQLSSVFFKDSTAFFCSLLFVPSILLYTKSIRMKSKDQFEETVMLRYKTEFWKRGSEFARAMNEKLCDDLIAMRKSELDEVALREEKKIETSSLEGGELVGDFLEKKLQQERERFVGAAESKGGSSSKGGKFLGVF